MKQVAPLLKVSKAINFVKCIWKKKERVNKKQLPGVIEISEKTATAGFPSPLRSRRLHVFPETCASGQIKHKHGINMVYYE